jgi:type I restriction enzyme S subunit
MATLQPYQKYYPVAYDYASQLPDGWQLLPNIAIFQERIERGQSNDERLLSVTVKSGIIRQEDVEIKKDTTPDDKSRYKLIEVGDIAFNPMNMWFGACGYSKYRGITSPVYTILKPKISLNPMFFHYMFRTKFYQNYSKRFSYGIMDERLSLRYLHFKHMYSIVPPLSVQNSIVAYLEQKNNEIDKFIRNKERLIELLEERKKHVITNTIFQEENPAKPLKYLVSKVGSGVTPLGGASVYISEGVSFLRSQNVHFDGLRLDDVAFISDKIHAKMKSTKVKLNDVLLNITGASIGRCCAIETEIEANVNQHVCIIRPKKVLNSKYLAYYLASTTIQNLIRNSQDGASREGLSFSEIKSFPVPVIPIEKQLEIVNQIKEIEIDIDLATSKAQKEISSIKEYREALITDLVTGKRSVPQLQMS